MRMRPLLTLFFGMTLAGSAVAYVHAVIKSPVAMQPMRDVVVAMDDIAFGHIVEKEDLLVRSWPSDAVPDGAFSSLTELLGEDEEKPRRTRFAIAKGEVVYRSKVSDFGEEVSITQQIDPSMRAVTIRVDDVTGVAGLVARSDRIDLTLTRTVEQGLVSSTILQDVEVLEIDKPKEGARGGSAGIRTVTVQVDPVDAQKLALAQQAGTLSLSLRHIDAADHPVLGSISVSDLTNKVRAKPEKKRPGLPSIVVNRRGQRLTVEVPSG